MRQKNSNMLIKPEETFQRDIDNISQINIVPGLLDVVCRMTGMRFAAIARVTEEKWVTCSVLDTINFGLKPGDELEIKTTICNEIRHNNQAVIIDHVAKDPIFHDHHTPAMYGFESYISVPIILKDGTFFGTLCSIDPDPHQLNTPETVGMFNLFAELIAFHLAAIEEINNGKSQLLEQREVHKKNDEYQKAFTAELEKQVKERTHQLEENNISLEKMNKELQSFAYISSHDLQEPLRKIQTFASLIADKEFDSLSDLGKDYFQRMRNAAERMQTLINDLLSYSRADTGGHKFESTDLKTVAEEVKEDLREELAEKDSIVEIGEMSAISIIPFQFRQLLYNLISNALKFSKNGQAAHIKIESEIAEGKFLKNKHLSPNSYYCHISVSDNGIGFPQEYNEKIFGLFQRLHSRKQYDGTGIGLAIVKKIVDNHHGYISAKGEMDKGATFDIFIPAPRL